MANGKPPVPPIEPIAIFDIVATDIFEIEDLGYGLRRLVWISPHPIPGAQAENHVVVKLVLPEVCLIPVSKKIAAAAHEVAELLTLVPNTGAAMNHKQEG